MNNKVLMDNLRCIPDFPQPGINFRDVTTLFKNHDCLQIMVDELYDIYKDKGITKIVGIESRGFIFGAPLAERFHKPFVPVRKMGKLPRKTVSQSYALEYGTATIEMHEDAVKPGERVVLVDDLLATGGTMAAACSLVERLGGTVAKILFVVELKGFDARNTTLAGRPVVTLLSYDGK